MSLGQADDEMTDSLGQEVYQVSELEQAIELRGMRLGAQKSARAIAKRMIISCRLPLSQIVEYTLLDQDIVEELAFEMGVVLPDTDFRHLVRNSASQTRADEPASGG